LVGMTVVTMVDGSEVWMVGTRVVMKVGDWVEMKAVWTVVKMASSWLGRCK